MLVTKQGSQVTDSASKIGQILKRTYFCISILILEQKTWLLTILCPILGRPSLQDVLNRGFKKWSMGHMTFFP